MKCSNCGYISSRDFYRCPYCGKVQTSEADVLKTRLTFGGGFSVRIKTIIYILLINLFAGAVLVDWFLGFKYAITLWSYIACFGTITALSIATSKTKILVSVVERVDFFLVTAILISVFLGRIVGVFDIRFIMLSFVFPSYLIVATVLSLVLLFNNKGLALRPMVTELLLLFHLVLISILFVFFMVNKYCLEAGIANAPFSFLQFGATVDGGKIITTPAYLASEILLFVAAGLSWAYFINYNFFLIAFVFRKVQNIYGGTGD